METDALEQYRHSRYDYFTMDRILDYILILCLGIPLAAGYVHEWVTLTPLCVPGIANDDGIYECGDSRDPAFGYPKLPSTVSTTMSGILSTLLYLILVFFNIIYWYFCNIEEYPFPYYDKSNRSMPDTFRGIGMYFVSSLMTGDHGLSYNHNDKSHKNNKNNNKKRINKNNSEKVRSNSNDTTDIPFITSNKQNAASTNYNMQNGNNNGGIGDSNITVVIDGNPKIHPISSNNNSINNKDDDIVGQTRISMTPRNKKQNNVRNEKLIENNETETPVTPPKIVIDTCNNNGTSKEIDNRMARNNDKMDKKTLGKIKNKIKFKRILHYSDVMLRCYSLISFLCVYVTQFIKSYLGMPRPSFYAYYDGGDANQGLKSFPSGHAAEAFGPMIVPVFFFIEVIDYIQKRHFVEKNSNVSKFSLRKIHGDDRALLQTHFSSQFVGYIWFLYPIWSLFKYIPLVSYFIAFIPVYFATWISLSRVNDYKHNISDVLTGALIGIFIGYYFGYKRYYYEIMGVNCNEENISIAIIEEMKEKQQQMMHDKVFKNKDEK